MSNLQQVSDNCTNETLAYVRVVESQFQEDIEDHVWFEYRWMVAFLCDE
jgi:hypothetical protein